MSSKGKGKKSKEKKSSSAGTNQAALQGLGEVEKPPIAFQISRQLDQEKINYLTNRIDELLKSNQALRQGASQNEKDTYDIVLYFKREMEIKDDVVLTLNEKLVKCQTQLKFEVEKVKKVYEQQFNEEKANSEQIIKSLNLKINTMENELKALEIFRTEKNKYELELNELKNEIINQRKQLLDKMETQERRFLEEKAQLFKELDEQKAAFREIALNEARAQISEETKKILNDNNRINEELRFHQNEAAQFQIDKKNLENELITVKRELEIVSDKEIEYARQAYNKSKEIKLLREKLENNNKTIKNNNDIIKNKTKQIEKSMKDKLDEALLDASSLKRLIIIKNKELRHMKALAATILSQRTETEQFFLEALKEVKELIRHERLMKEKEQQEQMELNNTLGNSLLLNTKKKCILPSIKTSSQINLMNQPISNTKLSKDQLTNLSNITISDLSFEDKELVLRILFSKINSSELKQAQLKLKEHAFDQNLNNENLNSFFISQGAGTEGELNKSQNFNNNLTNLTFNIPKSISSTYNPPAPSANSSSNLPDLASSPYNSQQLGEEYGQNHSNNSMMGISTVKRGKVMTTIVPIDSMVKSIEENIIPINAPNPHAQGPSYLYNEDEEEYLVN